MTQPLTGNAGLHVRYEKAGLIFDALPIPWNADAVIVEANVKLPAKAPRLKQDFTLRFADGSLPAVAELVHESEKSAALRVFFRIGVPGRDTAAEFFWREHALGRVELPILSATTFKEEIALTMPALHVGFGEQTAACRGFVGVQAKNVFASAVIRSPRPLAPALHIDLRVNIERENGERVASVLVPWTSDLLRAREAPVAVQLPKFGMVGSYRVSWHFGSRELCVHTVRVLGRKGFQQALRICATRYLANMADGTVRSLSTLPTRDGRLWVDGVVDVTPCFYVCSGVAGTAGLAPFALRALANEVVNTLAIQDNILVTDGPTPILLAAVPVGELTGLRHFTLASGERVLGNLPLLAAPQADFTAEGGFQPLDDFLWSPAADEQLKDRLGKLLDGG